LLCEVSILGAYNNFNAEALNLFDLCCYFQQKSIPLRKNPKPFILITKNMSYKYCYLAAMVAFTLLFSACENEEDKLQKIERAYRQNIKEKIGKECVTVEVIKEEENQYLINSVMNDGTKMQVIFKGTPENARVTETLNSRTMHDLENNVGVFCTDLVLRPKDSLHYTGVATLKTGENLKIVVHKDKGWYPENDTVTLATIIKHQICSKNKISSPKVKLTPINAYQYKGVMTGDSGVNIEMMVTHLGTEFRYDITNVPTHRTLPNGVTVSTTGQQQDDKKEQNKKGK
jgi:hypothetical protein